MSDNLSDVEFVATGRSHC